MFAHLFHNKIVVLFIVLLIGLVVTAGVIQAVKAAVADPVGWRQSNSDGFGTITNSNAQLEVFKGALYAGTWSTDIAQVWKTTDGLSWQQLTTPLVYPSTSLIDLQEFQDKLYIGVNGEGGNQIWRTADGSAWEKVVDQGFGEPDNAFINCMSVFSNTLYAATNNGATGVQIWRSATGNAGSWSKMHAFGADAPGNNGFTTMEVYKGWLYVGLSRNSIAQLWRTSTGTDWEATISTGMGNSNNSMISAMAVYQNLLYIGVRNSVEGGQVWRSSNGISWEWVLLNGAGTLGNSRPYGLIADDHTLYLVFSNQSTGAEVWSALDGIHWSQISTHGWGDANSAYADYLDNGAAIFQDHLYLGAQNAIVGAEIWERLDVSFLPVQKKGSQ